MKKIMLSVILVCVLCFACACQSSQVASSSNLNDSAIADISSEHKNEPYFEDVAKNFSAKITPQKVSLSGATSKTAANFSYELFKNSYIDTVNTLLSPISALSALTLSVNGADGETLSQMEAVLGADKDTLNKYLYSYRKSLSDDTFLLSQSVWLRRDINAGNEFMQANADYHAADIFSASMGTDTIDQINNWASKKTDGQIPKLVTEIPVNTVFYLINTAVFDSKWQIAYSDDKIHNYPFYNADGNNITTEFLTSYEQFYMSGENYIGFVKPYSDERYAFAAFLPQNQATLADLVNSFSGDSLMNAVSNAENEKIWVSMPMFSNEYQTDLVPALKTMGMNDTFDPDNADFSKICENCWISQVKQSAKIEVSREGTKAAAATAVVGQMKSANSNKIKTVQLSRPFLYAVVDLEANLPIFIGTTSYIN